LLLIGFDESIVLCTLLIKFGCKEQSYDHALKSSWRQF